MKKIACLVSEGFNAGEALTVCDILRRAGFDAELIGWKGQRIEGYTGVTVETDRTYDPDLSGYAALVLPSGDTKLSLETGLLENIRSFVSEGKLLAASGSGIGLLIQAGLGDYRLANREVLEKTPEDGVVQDRNLVTSLGGAYVYATAYRLIEMLGGDSEPIKARMVYRNAFRGR